MIDWSVYHFIIWPMKQDKMTSQSVCDSQKDWYYWNIVCYILTNEFILQFITNNNVNMIYDALIRIQQANKPQLVTINMLT